MSESMPSEREELVEQGRLAIARKGPLTARQLGEALDVPVRRASGLLATLASRAQVQGDSSRPARWSISPRRIALRAELHDALVGRTIVKADMDDVNDSYEEWNYQGGDLTLTLDNGAILRTQSSGYDCWSNEVGEHMRLTLVILALAATSMVICIFTPHPNLAVWGLSLGTALFAMVHLADLNAKPAPREGWTFEELLDQPGAKEWDWPVWEPVP